MSWRYIASLVLSKSVLNFFSDSRSAYSAFMRSVVASSRDKRVCSIPLVSMRRSPSPYTLTGLEKSLFWIAVSTLLESSMILSRYSAKLSNVSPACLNLPFRSSCILVLSSPLARALVTLIFSRIGAVTASSISLRPLGISLKSTPTSVFALASSLPSTASCEIILKLVTILLIGLVMDIAMR